jgi:phosphate/sulfate permease
MGVEEEAVGEVGKRDEEDAGRRLMFKPRGSKATVALALVLGLSTKWWDLITDFGEAFIVCHSCCEK